MRRRGHMPRPRPGGERCQEESQAMPVGGRECGGEGCGWDWWMARGQRVLG